MNLLFDMWNRIQGSLFPNLEETLRRLTDKQKQLVAILEILRIEHFVRHRFQVCPGAPEADRRALARAFVAKAVYNMPTTRALIDQLQSSPVLRRLCGWEQQREIPHESTSSRAFAEFANSELPQRVHTAMIAQHRSDRLVGHIARDSTEIDAREKPVFPPKTEAKEPSEKPKRKRGRPKKGEEPPPPEPTRIERQVALSAEAALAELPVVCDRGSKQDSKGYRHSWIGFKLHLDVADGDIPLSAVLTSVSLHDSQVAIPMAKVTASKVTYLYDLMDSAYDAKPIWDFSHSQGRVAIIDRNPRNGEKIEMESARARRYNQRSSVERVNARLKDDFGGRTVRVRGATKIMAHLMFGILALRPTSCCV